MATTRNLRDGKIILQDGSSTPKTLEIPISAGDFAFTLNSPTFIIMNRGKINSRKNGDEMPTDLSFSVFFEQWSYGNGSASGISVADCFQGVGGASDWVSTDPCGPFSISIVFEMDNPCAVGEKEVLTFGKFHADTIAFKEGNEYNTLSITGKALQQKPTRTYTP